MRVQNCGHHAMKPVKDGGERLRLTLRNAFPANLDGTFYNMLAILRQAETALETQSDGEPYPISLDNRHVSCGR